MDPGFTLEKAKKLVRQREAVRQEWHTEQFLTSISSEGATVEAISKNSGNKQVAKQKAILRTCNPSTQQSTTTKKASTSICYCCGWGAHSRQVRPAKDAACHKCKEKLIF